MTTRCQIFAARVFPDLVMLVQARHSRARPNAVPLPGLSAKNNGDGTFQKPTLTPLSISPYFFVVGDFNNDGKLDLLFYYTVCNSNNTCQTPALIPYLGNGDGTFRQGTAITFNPGTSSGVYGVLVADVNGDGKPDLLVSGSGLISSTDQNAMYEAARERRWHVPGAQVAVQQSWQHVLFRHRRLQP